MLTLVTLTVLTLVYDPTWLSDLNAVQLHELGILDPEGMRIKKEIHLNKKVDNKRWRLIWLGPVRTEIVDRIRHGAQNELNVAMFQAGHTHTKDFPTFGACVGMGHHDEGLAHMIEAFRRSGITDEKGVCLDASSFDVTVSLAMMMADGWRRCYLAYEGGAPIPFCRAQLVRAVTMSRHLIQTGKLVYRVFYVGIEASGLYSTADTNSFVRGFIHSAAYWVDEGECVVSSQMGDDLVTPAQVLPKHLQYWEDCGLIMDP